MENNKELPPLVVQQTQYPSYSSSSSPSNNTHKSIETLVVVLAVITILGVIAGIIARLCGGRHFSGNGEDDIEGCVEQKCTSCIDGGLPNNNTSPLQPSPLQQQDQAKATTTTTEESKK